MSIIVADASPLIALATIDQLELLHKLYQNVLIPDAVAQELMPDSNMAGAKRLKQAMDQGWLKTESCDYTLEPYLESYQQLLQIIDQGETEAILLAECLQANSDYRFLLIDERRGRQVAKKRGLVIVGTGAVLLAAKKKGYILSVKKELDKMQDKGYRLSMLLRRKLLELAGEAY
ncbi:MAG: DUF3368 domain-containing protein [Thiotrichaceae bacterium]